MICDTKSVLFVLCSLRSATHQNLPHRHVKTQPFNRCHDNHIQHSTISFKDLCCWCDTAMVPAGTMTLVVTENLAPSTHLLVSLEPLVNSKKRIHPSHSHSHNCKRQKHDHSRRKRRVSFAPSLTISILPKHHVETWYTVDDYMEFEQNVRNTIQILRDPSIPTPPESAHFTKRGLEKYKSHETHARKKRHEQLHIQAVLREQERQDTGARNVTIQGHFVTRVDNIPNLPCKWHSNKANEMPNKWMIWRTCIKSECMIAYYVIAWAFRLFENSDFWGKAKQTNKNDTTDNRLIQNDCLSCI